ncbi:response regulator [bacterium]|nr:response regulator [bacterium]
MKKHTLLVVDDEADILELVKDVFEAEGCYNVITAQNGNEALELADKHKISLILTDQRMPGMLGIELLEQMKIKYPNTIRILMTGVVDVNSAIQAINRGEVYKYIIKPWDIVVLRNTVKRAVEHFELIEETKQLQEDVKRANLELEKKVRERTQELEGYLAKLTETNHELGKANKKISDSYSALAQAEKLSSLGLMAGTIAHDIKNPLSIISGQTQILKMTLPEESPMQNGLNSIMNQVSRITTLVESIKNFARKSPDTHSHGVSIQEVLSECFILTGKLLKVNNVQLTESYSPNLPKIYGNKTKLEQVFMNLIQNAAQSMERQSDSSISIRCFEENENLVVEVTDSGPGMPEEVQKSIFNPFFTTKAEGQGTGLGLAICEKIIEEHRGKIKVESKIGFGTKFVITIPIDHSKIITEQNTD